jgi:phosphatidylserine/phosphatidylglycerophosphate/cardiolipin synthase-like enzyme
MLCREVFVAWSVLAFAACAIEPQPDEPVGQGKGAVEHIEGLEVGPLDLYFSPSGPEIEDRIAAEIQAAEKEIRVAMYNLRSARLGYLLLERQQAGVEVEVLWDAKQMAKSYNTLDDDLAAAGLNIVPILNSSSAYATLHDKLAVFDGRVVMMGSANWGQSGLFLNNESTLVFDSPELASIVDAELDEILSGSKVATSADGTSAVTLYFSPEDRLDEVTIDAIDAAEERIYAAVFSLRLSWLVDALIRAHQRGVQVYVVTDRKQSETIDQDERLRDAGIPVIEALNDTTPYTAMHHKFVVIDGRTTVTGSYNWSYTGTFHSYEDLAVFSDDNEVAAAFDGEFGRLWQEYAPDLPGPETGTTRVEVEAHCDGTAYGDTLVLVGDREELGAWDPGRGLRLSGESWPTWRGAVDLPAGARVEYKLVILRAGGGVDWESGGNREAVVPTDPNEPSLVLRDAFRY